MAFNFRQEYGETAVQSRGVCGLTAKEEEEMEAMMAISSDNDDDECKMDEADDAEPAFDMNLFEYPTIITPMVEYQQDAQTKRERFKFLRDRVPESFPFTSPHLLLGLDSISEISADQKRTLVGALCIPMPIHASPLVALMLCKVENNVVTPWKPKYVNWMHTANQLREFMFLSQSGLIPVPPQTPTSLPEECFEEFEFQINKFDEMQYDRIQELFNIARDDPTQTQTCVLKFIEYAEEASYHYLHSCERFLWRTLIEPHKPEKLELQDVLTPYDRPTLGQCENMFDTRSLVVDYFAIKVPAFKHKDQERAEKDYIFKDCIDLEGMKTRIQVHKQTHEVRYNCAPEHVYRGYIGLETIYQYWLFCDTASILGPLDQWHQKWNLTMWK